MDAAVLPFFESEFDMVVKPYLITEWRGESFPFLPNALIERPGDFEH